MPSSFHSKLGAAVNGISRGASTVIGSEPGAQVGSWLGPTG